MFQVQKDLLVQQQGEEAKSSFRNCRVAQCSGMRVKPGTSRGLQDQVGGTEPEAYLSRANRTNTT